MKTERSEIYIKANLNASSYHLHSINLYVTLNQTLQRLNERRFR